MSDWVQELNERSKDDRAIIVGSDVRVLVAEIARLRAALEAARQEAAGQRVVLEFTQREAALATKSVERALAAEAEVERLHSFQRVPGLFEVTAQRDAALAALEDLRGLVREVLAQEGQQTAPMPCIHDPPCLWCRIRAAALSRAGEGRTQSPGGTP